MITNPGECEYTIAIPAYNRAEFLKIILDKVLDQAAQLGSSGEVLIVNDGSADHTSELLAGYKEKYPGLRYLNNPQNLGISRTRNILVNQARGKYIIFIDSDVIPSDFWLQAHLETLRKYRNIICQGNLIFVSSIAEAGKKKASIFTDYSSAFFDTANVSAETMLIRRAGGFDENFKVYGWEDLELGLRLKKSGVRIRRNKQALGYHLKPPVSLSELDSYLEIEKNRAAGAVYFAGKHPEIQVKMMTQLTGFHFWLDKVLSRLLGLERKKFLFLLEKLEKNTGSILFFPLLRLYLNHFHLQELRKLVK